MKSNPRLLAFLASVAGFAVVCGSAFRLLRPSGLVPSPAFSKTTALVYYDDTNSASTPTTVADSTDEIVRLGGDWYSHALPGAAFEVYVTAENPGEPQRVLGYQKEARKRGEIIREKRLFTARLRQALGGLPHAPNSSLVEDFHTLLERGSRLTTPYSLTISSDLQQWTQHGLKGRLKVPDVLKMYPAPSKLPIQITVLYTPPRFADKPDSPEEMDARLAAWRTILVSWCGGDASRVTLYTPPSSKKNRKERTNEEHYSD